MFDPSLGVYERRFQLRSKPKRSVDISCQKANQRGIDDETLAPGLAFLQRAEGQSL
jgi:hypothetical protein